MKNLDQKCFECWNVAFGVSQRKNATSANQQWSSTNDKKYGKHRGQGFFFRPSYDQKDLGSRLVFNALATIHSFFTKLVSKY